MRFPAREMEIVRLAQDVSRGFTANESVFPAPPTTAAAIEEALAEYQAAREAYLRAQAAAQAGKTVKNAALSALAERLRSGLRYAESVANGDAGTLQLVGWGARRRRRRRGVPGQAMGLVVREEGPGRVELSWEAPYEGGPVSAYRITRRRREGGAWEDAGTAVATSLMLEDQPAGIELEYQVLAVNGAGEGPPSNVVRAVL